MEGRSKAFMKQLLQLFLDSLQDGAMDTAQGTLDSSTLGQGQLPSGHADRLPQGPRVEDRLNRKQSGGEKVIKKVVELMEEGDAANHVLR
ncbi:hypothetical protein NDU88_003181 [Pleurodeles waltl]|uniref:Uncharacterized protein n=1 Tax=Pleurodeles waltl TaxID=8319 RepID=A0AAV7W4W3_PLEWA|nr:hypothetical protein NDU88_003181 [Pleurodeles waltl]